MIGIPSSDMSADVDASSIRLEHSEVAIGSSLSPSSSIMGANSISNSLFGYSRGSTASAILGAIAACIPSLEK